MHYASQLSDIEQDTNTAESDMGFMAFRASKPDDQMAVQDQGKVYSPGGNTATNGSKATSYVLRRSAWSSARSRGAWSALQALQHLAVLLPLQIGPCWSRCWVPMATWVSPGGRSDQVHTLIQRASVACHRRVILYNVICL